MWPSGRDIVLKRMEDLQLLTPQRRLALQAHGAAARPLGLAPQYLAQIRTQLIARLGADAVEQGGLEVIAALDLDLQKRAEQTLRDSVKRLPCPVCGLASKVHDTEEKSWRHLDFFQHSAYLTARVPRCKCDEHGVKQVNLITIAYLIAGKLTFNLAPL